MAGTLPTYTLLIAVTVGGSAYQNIRVYVRNERTNETINGDTNFDGETLLDAANFTFGVATGDLLTIFTVYQNYDGSTTHTVTTGGADISLALTTISVTDALRYFTVQDYYDEVGYNLTDSDIISSVDVVKVGTDIEKEIDNTMMKRFDSANIVTDEYHDAKRYQNQFFLENTPIQSITGFFINDASQGSQYQWRNLGYNLLDAFTSTTEWTGASGGSDTITLSIDYTYDNRNEGTSCMYVAKSGTNNATVTVSNSSVTSTNFTDKKLNVDLYTIDTDDLTTTDAIEVRFGSDISNYFYKKWDVKTFSTTAWTTLNMSYSDSDCEVTGSPDITACTYFAVVLTLTAVTTTLTAGDIRLDHLRIGDNYLIEKDNRTGRVKITDSSDYPERGSQQVKVSYTYGYSSVPSDIRRLAVLMCARHFMLVTASKSDVSGREYTPQLGFMDAEIKRIQSKYQVWNIRNT